MANITVEVPHSHSVAEVQRRLSGFSDDLQRFGASLKWKANRAEVQGFGVSGDVVCEANRVRVTLKLGLAAKVAGVDPTRLENTIRRRLESALA